VLNRVKRTCAPEGIVRVRIVSSIDAPRASAHPTVDAYYGMDGLTKEAHCSRGWVSFWRTIPLPFYGNPYLIGLKLKNYKPVINVL